MERLRFDRLYVLMQIETQFGIVIRDSFAERIRTMGDLFEFILTSVKKRPQHHCVSSPAFYRLRRTLGDLFGVPRHHVRTSSLLEDLVPIEDRQHHWDRLRASLKLEEISPLRDPRWAYRLQLPLVAWAMTFIMALILVAAFQSLGMPLILTANLVAIGIVITFVVGWAGYRLEKSLEVRIPPSCLTVRDMVYTMVGHSSARAVSAESRPSDAETWSILCGIVGDEFNFQPSSLTPESHPWSL